MGYPSPQFTTPGLGDISGNAATTAFVNAALAPMAGKNRIINGDCRVQARPATFAATTGTSGYGGPDRFKVSNNGSAGGTVTQSASTITYGGVVRPCVLQTATVAATSFAGTNNWIGIWQMIEGYNAYDLIGQPFSISFIFQAKLPGTYSVSVRDSATAYSYVTTINVAAADTPQAYKLTIPAMPVGATIPCTNAVGLHVHIGSQNASGGAYNTSSLNTWQAANLVAASTNTNWGQTVNAYIALTELQLEAGSVCTAFDRRHIGVEIGICQRYYRVSSYRLDVPLNSATSLASTNITFGIAMRAAPANTVSSAVYGGSASAGTFNSFQALSPWGVALCYATQSTIGSISANLLSDADF